MRYLRFILPCAVLLAGCDRSAKQQLRELARADSLRTDSLVAIKNDLLNEVMASTQFVNSLNTELAKLKSQRPSRLSPTLTGESDIASIKEERAKVAQRIAALVARLDSSEQRVASLRARASKLAKHDSTLIVQVAQYETTIGELRANVERQRAEYEATIAEQGRRIAALTSRVDTMTRENVVLAGERTALKDTVGALTEQQNTAYYIVGTKDELIKAGVLVEEGHKRLFLVGSRQVSMARDLDPSKFTRIDRTRDRVINFPAGEYTIFSRQNPEYATPFASKDGKLSGGLRIDQPERFWEASKFLVIVRG
jgi:hypothetical protein